MKKLRNTFLIAAVLTLLGTTAGRAVVTYYTTAAAYNAASTNNAAYDFQGQPAGVKPSPFTVGPLSFSASRINVFYDNGYNNGLPFLGAYNSAETITLDGASALAFNLGSFDPTLFIAIDINGSAVTTFKPGYASSTAFIGFTSTTPITSLTFTQSEAGVEIDVINFQVGTAVPEPSTWALLGIGAIGAGVVALRRRRGA